MRNTIAIEGIDGSGKTSTAHALATEFEADGLHAKVYAPYRLATERLGEDIYNLWQTPETAKAAVEVMHGVLDDCGIEARDEGVEVVIYDRHWMTAFTEIIHDPEAVEAWGQNFVPIALLKANPQLATQRQQNDLGADWSTLRRQVHYDNVRTCLSKRYPQHILGIYRSDSDVTVKALARQIQSDMRFSR